MKTIHFHTSEHLPVKRFPLTKRFAKKRYLFLSFIFILILNILFSSCNDDGYSLNDFYGDYGVVHKTSDTYTIRTDHGAVLYPAASNVPSCYLQNNDRILVNFTILGDADTTSPYDYYVKVNDVYKILTKNIVEYTPVISDSLGHDPVYLNDLWINNGFITFDFHFGGGQPGIKHMVNLTRHPLPTTDNRILLEFRHNAFNDAYTYNYRGLVAFPLYPIEQAAQDSVRLRILYTGYEKEEAIDLTWYLKDGRQTKYRLEGKEEDFPKDHNIR